MHAGTSNSFIVAVVAVVAVIAVIAVGGWCYCLLVVGLLVLGCY